MPLTIVSRLDPRRSLRARVGLAFAAGSLIFAVLVSLLVGNLIARSLHRFAGVRLGELAYQTADKLDRQMFERYKDVSVLAAVPGLRDGEWTVAEQREVLEKLQRSYPDYAWIGVVAPDGTVVAGTGGILEGVSMAQRTPFLNGRTAPSVGDVHEAILLARLLPETSDGVMRLLDISAPIFAPDGSLRGVLVAHPSWAWTREVQASLEQSAGSEHGIEMLILGADGTVLLQPDGSMQSSAPLPLESVSAARQGQTGARIESWPDGVEYVTGFARSRGFQSYPGLGWIVLVRQRSDVALAPIQAIQLAIVLVAFALGLVFAVVGWLSAARILRPLRRLAVTAERVRLGQRDLPLPEVNGRDEFSSLARTVHRMIAEVAAHETELRELNQSLEDRVRERTREAQLLSLVARHTDNAVLITDGAHKVIWANAGFMRLTGFSLGEVLGRRPAEVLAVAADSDLSPTVTPFADGRTPDGQTVEHVWRTRSGEETWVAVEYQTIHDEDGALTNSVLIARDETACRAVEDKLRHDALHDSLTGLPNRALFSDRLAHAVRRILREPGLRFAVLFSDLDGFKSVNDTLGHAMGDRLLIGTARRLEACLRPGDTVARLGGDEMAVLLEAPVNVAEARAIAQRILDTLEEPFVLDGNRVQVGASVGIALCDDPSLSAEVILHHADTAMYEAKRRGKGQWAVYGSDAASLARTA
ncbi:MAG: diguanylate cyclase [Chloroflexi bacterium]|nr:diguanylate cyclase [Chloroflexota bacterium]